jgi:hypothetical protein
MSPAFPIRAVYTVAELARLGNVPTPRMRRMLRASGVVMMQAGRQLFVPFDELREKIPGLMRNLAVVHGARAERQKRESA